MINNRSLMDVELKFIIAITGKGPPAVPASSNYAAMQSFMVAVTQRPNVPVGDAYVLVMHYHSLWDNFSDAIIHLDEMRPIDRVGFERDLRANLGNPAFAFWYQTFKPTLVPQAVGYVDSLNIVVGDDQSLSLPVKSAQSG